MRRCFGIAAIFALSTTGVAEAKCDYLVQAGARHQGDRLIDSYKKLIRCDKNAAQDAYKTYMQQAGKGGTESLSNLALVAIDNQIWNPVWEMIGKISDYNMRDEVAAVIGEKCASKEKVVNFLQGAYFGLRDLDFKQWDDALIVCESPTFEAWLIQNVENPPAKQYDEKWDTLADVLTERKKVGALPHLTKAAVAAAKNNGPYDTILSHMADSIDAPFGQEPNPEEKTALEAALVEVAKQVGSKRALAVAGQLADAGSEDKAASLLPSIYPKRVAADGSFLWAGAAVEAGTCKDGEKVAIVHLAVLKDPGNRFDVFDEATAPLRKNKARLKKCTVDVEPWPIWVSEKPLKGARDAEKAATPLIADWKSRGYKVRIRSEKSISLP